MKLELNEFTIQGLLDYLESNFQKKVTGKPFTRSDIAQYCLRGYLPYRYGGDLIQVSETQGVKVIKLTKNPHFDGVTK